MVQAGDRAPDFTVLEAGGEAYNDLEPFTLSEALTFPMLSDWEHEVIHAYDAVLDDMYGSIEVARRTVFVVDAGGTVTVRKDYDTSDPDIDVDEIAEAVAAAGG